MGEGHTGEPRDGPSADHRLTVAQAAERLGITKGAVRSRIKRGTLPTAKEAGHVYVLWGGGTSPAYHAPHTDEPPGVPTDQSELVAVLREQLAAEREAHSETRRLLAFALERIPPAIEAPPDQRDAPETSREDAGGEEDRPERAEAQEGVQEHSATAEPPIEETVRRPWWLRILGG